jgi:MFS transporter, DHA1 family, inner membrane transport protein
LMPAVMGLFAALTVVLLVFYQTSVSPLPAIITMVVWGAVTFALVSPLQMRVVDEAIEAPNLAATLNQGAFNLGNASGAWFGGLAVSAGYAYRALPLLGAVMALLGLGLTVLSYGLERQRVPAE